MGKPAARLGDEHVCPKVTPGTPPVPHVGGPIVGAGAVTVLIGGQPAATLGEACICVGEPDKIVSGSSGVLIGGKPAARMGDQCAHGGVVVGGCVTVLIGERMGSVFFAKIDSEDLAGEEFVEPTDAEKEEIIRRAIQHSIVLLESKLNLLKAGSENAMNDFATWFGEVEGHAVASIVSIITKALEVVKGLTFANFKTIEDERLRKIAFAQVDYDDRQHNIQLGDLFWKGEHPCELVIIHELSHFEDVGLTFDFDYGENNCRDLAQQSPDLALINACNFEYFIKG